MKKILVMLLLGVGLQAIAQVKTDKELKLNLNDDGTHFLKATFTAQVWNRYTDNNPGSSINGYAEKETYDIGLRRVRAQFFGKITNNIFLYTQIGINNFGYNSARKPAMFFHDVVTEYYITPRTLQIGTGLSAWTGFARYSSPAVASILGYDAPLYQQSTNDVNDQFLRKLSLYAKGKVGKVDYRFILSKPMLIDGTTTTVKPINLNSDFAYTPPKIQTSAYVMYQFLEEESNLTPYITGTYLGKKKVLNIGAGYQYQPLAMWHYNDSTRSQVVKQPLLNYAIDVFFDHPVGEKGSAITLYAAAAHTDYGKNYLRNNGIMNPTSSNVSTSLNGGGNAFAMYGTGNVYHVQVGYLLPQKLLGETNGQLQPYADITIAKYDLLKDDMVMWNAGVNWLVQSHKAKLSLNYQNRPIFSKTEYTQIERKGMVVLQIQIAI
jgi:hypothetical protein